MPLTDNTHLVLAQALERHAKQKGGYSALARMINESNGRDADAAALVDRRKLKSIVDEHPRLVLSLEELVAIDRYLTPYNEGLARQPLFRAQENVVAKLAETGNVKFLLGSKTEEEEGRVIFSHWDVMAMAEVQREVYRYSENVQFDFHDVLLHKEAKRARRAHERKGWPDLFADDGPSLVCLGSIRALHATELMLSRMFGVRPFGASGVRGKNRVPFHFVWPKGLDHVFPSSFHMAPEEEGAYGLMYRTDTGSELCVDTLKPDGPGDSHGVAVAQRRGRWLWVCLAGVRGLGTLAAARILREMSPNLIPDPGERESPVYWMPFRAHAERHPDHADGHQHELKQHTTLGGPYLWPA